MGQVLHGSATTTTAIRRAIQHGEASLRALAKRYGVNQKTVAKWKRRSSVADVPTGPKEPRSTVLTVEDEAIVVAFRRHTLLPLDDCLYALQPTLPHLTRSSLHRCLQRHGISRLPDVEGDKPAKRKVKTYALGFFHILCPAGVCSQTPRGTSPRACPREGEGPHGGGQAASLRGHRQDHEVRLRPTAREGDPARGGRFASRALVKAVPYRIHTILTDNGTHFTDPRDPGSAAVEIAPSRTQR